MLRSPTPHCGAPATCISALPLSSACISARNSPDDSLATVAGAPTSAPRPVSGAGPPPPPAGGKKPPPPLPPPPQAASSVAAAAAAPASRNEERRCAMRAMGVSPGVVRCAAILAGSRRAAQAGAPPHLYRHATGAAGFKSALGQQPP